MAGGCWSCSAFRFWEVKGGFFSPPKQPCVCCQVGCWWDAPWGHPKGAGWLGDAHCAPHTFRQWVRLSMAREQPAVLCQPSLSPFPPSRRNPTGFPVQHLCNCPHASPDFILCLPLTGRGTASPDMARTRLCPPAASILGRKQHLQAWFMQRGQAIYKCMGERTHPSGLGCACAKPGWGLGAIFKAADLGIWPAERIMQGQCHLTGAECGLGRGWSRLMGRIRTAGIAEVCRGSQLAAAKIQPSPGPAVTPPRGAQHLHTASRSTQTLRRLRAKRLRAPTPSLSV